MDYQAIFRRRRGTALTFQPDYGETSGDQDEQNNNELDKVTHDQLLLLLGRARKCLRSPRPEHPTPGEVFASKVQVPALIHTGLQPGDQTAEEPGNRFNGFYSQLIRNVAVNNNVRASAKANR
jgi:hypothetical protein